MTNKYLTQKELIELLSYDPKSGIFSWKIKRGNRTNVNGTAGSLKEDGYNVIGLKGKLYSSHRLAWIYVYGEWPKGQIDHINHIRNDNRIDNLRDVSASENSMNRLISNANTSGCIGVCWDKEKTKWEARIKTSGKQKHIGYFKNKIDAIIARKMAEYEHGFHPNHGNQ